MESSRVVTASNSTKRGCATPGLLPEVVESLPNDYLNSMESARDDLSNLIQARSGALTVSNTDMQEATAALAFEADGAKLLA